MYESNEDGSECQFYALIEVKGGGTTRSELQDLIEQYEDFFL